MRPDVNFFKGSTSYLSSNWVFFYLSWWTDLPLLQIYPLLVTGERRSHGVCWTEWRTSYRSESLNTHTSERLEMVALNDSSAVYIIKVTNFCFTFTFMTIIRFVRPGWMPGVEQWLNLNLSEHIDRTHILVHTHLKSQVFLCFQIRSLGSRTSYGNQRSRPARTALRNQQPLIWGTAEGAVKDRWPDESSVGETVSF